MEYESYIKKHKDTIINSGLVPKFDEKRRGKNKPVYESSGRKWIESPWYIQYDEAVNIFEGLNDYCPNCDAENYLEDVYHGYNFECSYCNTALMIFYNSIGFLPYEPDDYDR